MRGKETCGITGIRTISQMGSSDEQSSITDQIAHCTVNLGLVLRVPGDLTIILEISGESKQNHCLDLVPHLRG